MRSKLVKLPANMQWGNARAMELAALRSMLDGKNEYLMANVMAGIIDEDKMVTSVMLCTTHYGVCIDQQDYHLKGVPESDRVTKALGSWSWLYQPDDDLVQVFWSIGVSREKTIDEQKRDALGFIKKTKKKIRLLELVTPAEEHGTWLNMDVFKEYFPRETELGIPDYEFYIRRENPRLSPIFIAHHVDKNSRILDGFIMPIMIREETK